MPYATNGRDGTRVYFEDDAGDGAAVVLHGVRFPDPQRARWLANDPAALGAAWSAALAEGAISEELGRWRVPCLIFIGAAEGDFLDGARRAAVEIPNAETSGARRG